MQNTVYAIAYHVQRIKLVEKEYDETDESLTVGEWSDVHSQSLGRTYNSDWNNAGNGSGISIQKETLAAIGEGTVVSVTHNSADRVHMLLKREDDQP